MKIGVGADHRGIRLKSLLIGYLKKKGYKASDYGTNSEKSADYPEIALRLAHDIVEKKIRFGILSCYTGQGMAMTANKVKGIRAAICTTPEIARLARAHNNANILVIPGYLEFDRNAKKIIGTFLKTKFEGGRHLRRINIIKRYENSTYRI
jgi:ribose 5-phosphate isomerase B